MLKQVTVSVRERESDQEVSQKLNEACVRLGIKDENILGVIPIVLWSEIDSINNITPKRLDYKIIYRD